MIASTHVRNAPYALSVLTLALTLGIAHHRAPAATADLSDLNSAGVTDLALSPIGGGGGPRDTFAPGTEEVVASFRYEETERTRIAVVVKSRGGIVCFRSEDRYSGAGVAQITLSGSAMAPALIGAIDGAAREARRNADRAADPARQAGTHEYLLSVQAGLLRVGFAAETLVGSNLPDETRTRLDDLDRLREEATRLIERAVGLPAVELDQKKSLAGQAADRLGSVVLIAGELITVIAQIDNLAIPTTGSGEQDGYVVQLEVEGDVAASIDLWVAGNDAIYLPYGELGR